MSNITIEYRDVDNMYVAKDIRYDIVGVGDTSDDAMQDLANNILQYLEHEELIGEFYNG